MFAGFVDELVLPFPNEGLPPPPGLPFPNEGLPPPPGLPREKFDLFPLKFLDLGALDGFAVGLKPSSIFDLFYF